MKDEKWKELAVFKEGEMGECIERAILGEEIWDMDDEFFLLS